MGGEHEQDEPADVDLDRLLDEIGNSMALAPSANISTQQNHWSDALTEVPEPEDDGMALSAYPPKQSTLDFDMKDDSHAGECAPLSGSTTAQKGEEVMSRGVLMGAAVLGALGILGGAAGLFMAVSASSQIEALQQSLDGLQGRLATMQVSGDPRVGQLQAEQAGMSSRLDELATRLEGLAAAPAVPSAHLTELDKRLEALERKAAQPVKATATTQRATTSAKTGKTASGSGGWAVILVSFPSSAQAESEKGRLQKLGIAGEVIKSQIDGKSWYRVSVPGYGSHESAKAAIPGLESKSGIKGAWVAQR